MTLSKKYGRIGEELAKKYLLENGYEILKSNYRFKRSEIDLIAKKKDRIHFVEVKFRRSYQFGFPEAFLSHSQIHRIQDASTNFLIENNLDIEIQFDIISVYGGRIEHFEDAF